MLDLNDVALLVRVVQTHSFSAAARERGVPVSTVSRRVARLESSLGIRLLERTTRSLQLTDAGRAYFTHAERAVDDLAQGTDVVRELQKEPRGRVRICAPAAVAQPITVALFDYLAARPGVAIDLVFDRGRPEDFDIAILTGKVEDSTDFVARPIWRPSRKLLVASPKYLEARKKPKTVDDLARHDCIAGGATDGIASWTLQNARKKRRITFEPRFSANEYSAAYRAALAGLGIALVPEVYCQADLAKKRLARVLDGWEGEAGGISLLYRAHRSLTAAVRTCVDHLLVELPAADPARR